MKNKISFGIMMMFSFVLGGLCMYYFSYTHRIVVTENNSGISASASTNANLGDKGVTQTTCKNCNNTVIVDNGNLSSAIEKAFNAAVMVKNFKNNTVAGSGSGFIYKLDDKYAYIMTNHHVVSGGNKWTIITNTDEEIEGKVLGSDEYLDLAVIRVDKKSYMSAATIGNDSNIKLGDTVFTIGSPVGYEYRGTVTNGIISGLNRLVEVSVNSVNIDWVMEVIQTNAAVNPGNSGGPLINANGEVIGVISMKFVKDSIEGMGFAIPIDYATSYLEYLENGKKIERPLLGTSMINISESYTLWRNGIMVPEGIDEGVVIAAVEPNTGADKAGLQKGDIILEIDGSKAKNSAYLKYLLFKHKPGDTVKITYSRDNKIKTATIKLTKNEN